MTGARKSFPKNFTVGLLIVILGCGSQKLIQCDRYRDFVLSGYWKQYNSPSGLKWASLQNLMIVGVGLAMCFGLIEFNK